MLLGSNGSYTPGQESDQRHYEYEAGMKPAQLRLFMLLYL
jgi:hypothetical protein